MNKQRGEGDVMTETERFEDAGLDDWNVTATSQRTSHPLEAEWARSGFSPEPVEKACQF